MECKICNCIFKNTKGLSVHLANIHSMSILDYSFNYDDLVVPKCEYCGNDCQIRHGITFSVTCGSQECRNKHQSKNARVKFERMLNGYKAIYKPDYPYVMSSDNWKGYVYEHIYVMQEKIGRKLFDHENVHHLDQDRLNNSTENLLLIDSQYHKIIHNWISAGAPRILSPINGYRYIKANKEMQEMYPNMDSNLFPEYLYVLYKTHGRVVSENEVVVHLNNDLGDNSKNNMIIISKCMLDILNDWLNKSKKSFPSKIKLNRIKYCYCGEPNLGWHKYFCSSLCKKEYVNNLDRKSVKTKDFNPDSIISLIPNKPSKDVLEEDIRVVNNFCALGRKYGVSDNTIRRWAEKYGIIE